MEIMWTTDGRRVEIVFDVPDTDGAVVARDVDTGEYIDGLYRDELETVVQPAGCLPW